MSDLASVEELKAAANAAFGAKKFIDAVDKYTDALAQLSLSHTDENAAPVVELKATLLLNRAAAFLDSSNFDAALQDCNAALAIDPAREKAVFRRAQAQEGLGKHGEAFKDFKALVGG